VPIYALTPSAETAGRVTLFRNVIPKPICESYGEKDAPQATRDGIALMLYDHLVRDSDLVIMTLGTPMGKAGGTNAMKIIRVGEVFDR
jgi:pyruvate kinase